MTDIKLLESVNDSVLLITESAGQTRVVENIDESILLVTEASTDVRIIDNVDEPILLFTEDYSNINITLNDITEDIVLTPTGEQGLRGLSAYQVWLEEGNTGTVAEFFETLSAGFVPGPGFKLVGAELRYDIASLTRL